MRVKNIHNFNGEFSWKAASTTMSIDLGHLQMNLYRTAAFDCRCWLFKYVYGIYISEIKFCSRCSDRFFFYDNIFQIIHEI